MQEVKSGDKVAVVAPCAQIGDVEKISLAVQYLQKCGLVPVYGQNLLKVNRYMAGTDEQRAADVNAAFADNEIKAIFCVRAAAGGTRVLPYLDYELARRNPKPLIGFCDNAALQLALWQKSGLVSYYGFVMTYDFKNGTLDSVIASDLHKLLNHETYEVVSGKTLHGGKARGQLLCSNLTVLTRMAGTPYFPDLDGKILLLEDVHEKIYRVDLMLQQIKQQPHFERLKGVIFGNFSDADSDAEDGTLDDCLYDFLQGTNIPAISGFDFGHTVSRRVLPIGAEAELDADAAVLKILQY